MLHLSVAHYPFHKTKHTWNINICCNVSKACSKQSKLMNGWMMLMFMKCKCKCGSQTPRVLQVGPNLRKGMRMLVTMMSLLKFLKLSHVVLHLSMTMSGRGGLPSGWGATSRSTQLSIGLTLATTASNLTLYVRASCSSTSNCALTLWR